MLSFYDEHDWYFRTAVVADVRKKRTERHLRLASAVSEEVLARLYDIRARLEVLHLQAVELARGARPADKATRQ